MTCCRAPWSSAIPHELFVRSLSCPTSQSVDSRSFVTFGVPVLLKEDAERGGSAMQALDTAMKISFVDLKAQYDSIKPEVDAAIAAVIKQTAFIGGPYVKEFEEAFARYCG